MKHYCAPTEHDYQAHAETIAQWYGYGYTGKTLLYCRKCGHHFYTRKTPQDYSPPLSTSNVTITAKDGEPLSYTFT